MTLDQLNKKTAREIIADAMKIFRGPSYVKQSKKVISSANYGAYSTANWTPIPSQTGHPFHGKLDSQSSANWTPIPLQTGQFEAV